MSHLDETTAAALRRAIKSLERRDRFEAEVRADLANEPDDTASAVFALLGPFIDDRRAIESYLRSHAGKRALGRDLMRKELSDRGAPGELVEEALAKLPADDERALELIEGDKKARKRAQAGRFLFSRGFSEECVEAAIEKIYGSPDVWE